MKMGCGEASWKELGTPRGITCRASVHSSLERGRARRNLSSSPSMSSATRLAGTSRVVLVAMVLSSFSGGRLDRDGPWISNCREFQSGVINRRGWMAEAEAGLVAEKRKLRKSLFRFDMIFFTVCAIVALDTIGQSSSYGAQAIFWLIVSALTFLIPYGLITAELGAAFPTEGATYDWVRLAYGHFAGAVVSVLYWLSNPIWLGGTLTATTIAALDALWGSQLNGQQGWETVIGFFFIWTAVTMNILSLRYMKWVPNLGAFVRLALLAFFAVLVGVSGIQHGFHGSLGGFSPTDSTVLIGVIGVIVFQWIGFELQTNASEEMENPQRDIPRAIYASGIISFLAYAIP